MTISIFLQFVVVLAAIWMGARYSGVGLGLFGAVGLLVLVLAFGVVPTARWPLAADAPAHCSNFGAIRFSNENTSSHFSCVSSLRSLTTMSCRLLPLS